MARNYAKRLTTVRRRIKSSDIFQRATSAVSRAFSKPLSLVLIILAITLFISYESDKTDNLATKALDKFGNNTVTEFVRSNLVQSIAFVGYTGAITATAPPQAQSSYLLVAGILAYLVPESNNFEYLVQAILLGLFIALKRPSDRVIICAVAALAYFGGYAFSSLKSTSKK